MHKHHENSTFSDVFLKKVNSEHFPGIANDEKIEFFMNKHWTVLIWPCSILIGALLVGITLNILYAVDIWASATGIEKIIMVLIHHALLVTWLHVFFIKILNYFMHVTLVTSSRIIVLDYTTVFHRKSDSIDFASMQDIIYSKIGLTQMLFNYGEIIIHNASGHEVFKLSSIPYPEKHYNIINHVYCNYKDRLRSGDISK
jgi:flagellar biosynthesis protein FliQ